jgi:threonine dehydrogenase-like Zn-dependent dehydrogenase
MKAVKFLGKGHSEVIEVPKPRTESGQVLVKVMVSAVCGSERGGYMSDEPADFIPGHEFCGEIVESSNAKMLKNGDRVTINVLTGCGECMFCHLDLPQFCRSIGIVQGGHAEYAVVPEENCIKLADDVPYDVGVLIGGDTLGVAYRVVAKLPNNFGKIVYVSGSGPIGLGVIRLLKYHGYFVIASDFNKYRVALAKDVAGADVSIDLGDQNAHEVLQDLSNGYGPDIVVECSGSPAAQKTALEEVRCQGTVVFAGENTIGLEIVPSHDIIHKEITLTGAFYYAKRDYYEMYELYKRDLEVMDLVTHRYMLSDASQAMETFFSGDAGKVLIYRYDFKKGQL